MDQKLRGLLDRLVEGRGPVEAACLLKEVIGCVVKLSCVNRNGLCRIMDELAAKFPLPNRRSPCRGESAAVGTTAGDNTRSIGRWRMPASR